jgi:hypothetical protein
MPDGVSTGGAQSPRENRLRQGKTLMENAMDIVTLIVQLVSGALGGNIAGALLRNFSLSTIGNSLAGIIGGGLGGQLLGQYFNLPAVDTATLDPAAILGQIGSGGVGGIVVLLIVGVLKSLFAKA